MTVDYVPSTDEIRFAVQAGGASLPDFEAWLLMVRQQAIADYLSERDVPKMVLEFDPKVPIHGELLALRDARIRLEGKAEGWDEAVNSSVLHYVPWSGLYSGVSWPANPYREALHG